MKAHEIRALLVKHQISQARLAEELGVSQAAVSGAIRGKWKSRRICEEVARRLKLPVTKLWPKLAA
jgi:predicted transcriptional regulator